MAPFYVKAMLKQTKKKPCAYSQNGIFMWMRPNVNPIHTKLRGPPQVSVETKIQVGDLSTQKPPLYTDVKTSQWQDRPSIKHVCSAPHKQLFTEEDGTQKAERNICLMTYLQAVFSLLFSPFFCLRPALRSASPPTTPSNPCTSDGRSSIHHRDLWSLIVGKWSWGWPALGGRGCSRLRIV